MNEIEEKIVEYTDKAVALNMRLADIRSFFGVGELYLRTYNKMRHYLRMSELYKYENTRAYPFP